MNYIIVIAIVAIVYYFLYRQNNKIDITHYVLPADVDNELTVVHLSDLHTKQFGPGNTKLFDSIEACEPDLIVITGDIINRWDDKVPAYIDELSELKTIAPVYAIPGNHEMVANRWDSIRIMLHDAGIRVLENDVGVFSKVDERVSILGLNEFDEPDLDVLYARLNEMGGYRLVLNHYPLSFETNIERPFDLQLSGHAHGGQWRLPVIGGLYSPDQGFNPHYDAGLFVENGRRMIVSRGMGNSAFPLRLFNHPQIVCITLSRQ